MPYRTDWVDPEVFMVHNGVTIWHVYKGDQIEQEPRQYRYAFSRQAADDGDGFEFTFDVRDLPGGLHIQTYGGDTDEIKRVIAAAIDAGRISNPKENDDAVPAT